jgi:hypothetical protein
MVDALKKQKCWLRTITLMRTWTKVKKFGLKK